MSTPKLQTATNASEFVYLENMIGSLHTWDTNQTQLIVRDKGMTSSQRLLLYRYENVEIASSAYVIEKHTQTIDVRTEFISVDGKLIHRKAGNHLNYIDSVRKRFRLAIVIPFIRTQLNKVLAQLNMTRTFLPCRQALDSTDLIFYHNEAQSSSLETIIHEQYQANKCFSNVRFLAADLTDKQNQYPLGSAFMWQKLIVDDPQNRVSLRSYGYTHFFLMEPDTQPIRQFWLDAIVQQITQDCSNKFFTTNWWMSGSIYRGSKSIGLHFLHINGNALYHLSPKFIEYVKRLLYLCASKPGISLGYDLDIFSLLLENTDMAKEMWHKFKFSDFIQNCWQTGCPGCTEHNCTQFALDNPHTYLVHGGRILELNSMQENNHIKQILLLFMIVIMLIMCRNRYRGYRLNLKRAIRFIYK